MYVGDQEGASGTPAWSPVQCRCVPVRLQGARAGGVHRLVHNSRLWRMSATYGHQSDDVDGLDEGKSCSTDPTG